MKTSTMLDVGQETFVRLRPLDSGVEPMLVDLAFKTRLVYVLSRWTEKDESDGCCSSRQDRFHDHAIHAFPLINSALSSWWDDLSS